MVLGFSVWIFMHIVCCVKDCRLRVDWLTQCMLRVKPAKA